MWIVLIAAAGANIVLVDQVLDLQSRLEQRPLWQVQQVVPAARPAVTGGGVTAASLGTGCQTCGLETGSPLSAPPLSSPLLWPVLLGFASIVVAAAMAATLTSRIRAHSGLIEQIGRERKPLLRLAAPDPVRELSTDLARTNQLMVELNNVATLIGRTAGDSAHALRSPLSVVKIAIRRVRSQVSADGALVNAALDAAEANVDRMFEIIDASQRLDEETATLIVAPRRTEDLADVVRDALQRCTRQLETKSLRVSFCSQDGALVSASQGMLEELLDDLLCNAADASPECASIDVRLVATARLAVLQIEDQGSWISPDAVESAFERDYTQSGPVGAGRPHDGRLKDSRLVRRRSYYVANRNADLLGGDLALDNRPAGGVSVVIRLPLA